jgi:hypothetical protein
VCGGDVARRQWAGDDSFRAVKRAVGRSAAGFAANPFAKTLNSGHTCLPAYVHISLSMRNDVKGSLKRLNIFTPLNFN